MVNINSQILSERLVFFVSFFIAADKLQYQSLDAVNKEGMLVPIITSAGYNALSYHR